MKFNAIIFTTLIILAFFIYYIVDKIMKIRAERKVEIKRKENLKKFYNQMKDGYVSLKPHLDKVEHIVQTALGDKENDLGQRERNQILFAYNFYIDCLSRISSNKPLSDDDLTYLAEIHITYIEMVKDWDTIAKTKKHEQMLSKFSVN